MSTQILSPSPINVTALNIQRIRNTSNRRGSCSYLSYAPGKEEDETIHHPFESDVTERGTEGEVDKRPQTRFEGLFDEQERLLAGARCSLGGAGHVK